MRNRQAIVPVAVRSSSNSASRSSSEAFDRQSSASSMRSSNSPFRPVPAFPRPLSASPSHNVASASSVRSASRLRPAAEVSHPAGDRIAAAGGHVLLQIGRAVLVGLVVALLAGRAGLARSSRSSSRTCPAPSRKRRCAADRRTNSSTCRANGRTSRWPCGPGSSRRSASRPARGTTPPGRRRSAGSRAPRWSCRRCLPIESGSGCRWESGRRRACNGTPR